MQHKADLWKEAAGTEDPVITVCAFSNDFSGSSHEPQTQLVRAYADNKCQCHKRKWCCDLAGCTQDQAGSSSVSME